MVGVLALYRIEANAFNRDQLRIVQAITSKLATAIQNGLSFRQATASARNRLSDRTFQHSLTLHASGC